MSRLSTEQIHARLTQANELARDPEARLPDLASMWNITVAGASMFLENHDGTLRETFRHRGSCANLFTKEEALFRLKFVKSQDDKGATRANTAKLLGINPSGLSMWLSRWASDSIELAIEDLEINNEE